MSRNLRRVPPVGLERSEYARRDRDIAWYLLRGAIWKSWTRYVALFKDRLICAHDLLEDLKLKLWRMQLLIFPLSMSSALLSRIGFR